MKARVLLAILATALATACSSGALTTAAEDPSLDGTGTIGSGHRTDAEPDTSQTDGGGMMGSGYDVDLPLPETYSSPVIGSGH